MTPSRSPARPGYQRIADTLAREFAAHALPGGTRVGSQREFMDRFRVSSITIEGALRELERRQLIYRIRGRGTYLAEPAKTKREIRIGIVGHAHTNWETNDYARDVFRAVQVYAQGKPCYLRFIEREQNYAELLTAGHVDGILVLAPMEANLVPLQELDPNRHAYVLFGAEWGPHPSITFDNRACVRQAVDHLARLGHRRIAMVADPLVSWDTRERTDAFRRCMRARRWKVRPEWIVHLDGYQVRGAAEEQALFDRLFGSRQRPTAVLGLGSNIAADIARLAEVRGLRVPSDLSVVGLDQPPINSPWRETLTVFRQPLDVMARQAMDVLMERCQGGTRDPARACLPAVFRRGGSTAPPLG